MRDLIMDFLKDLEDEKLEENYNNSSIADELQKLAELKDNGHLSEEEFEAFKRKLMD